MQAYDGHAEPLTQSARLLFAPLLGDDATEDDATEDTTEEEAERP
ncbi:MAG: hypothetical protein R2856_31840 [Caldilineaceae bacterium]